MHGLTQTNGTCAVFLRYGLEGHMDGVIACNVSEQIALGRGYIHAVNHDLIHFISRRRCHYNSVGGILLHDKITGGSYGSVASCCGCYGVIILLWQNSDCAVCKASFDVSVRACDCAAVVNFKKRITFGNGLAGYGEYFEIHARGKTGCIMV